VTLDGEKCKNQLDEELKAPPVMIVEGEVLLSKLEQVEAAEQKLSFR
jgi:hypothetical protein